MARPKTMPTRKIGVRLMMGPVVSTPNRLAPQPHWKTATMQPRAASTESRKPKAALRGMTTDRKTTSRSRMAMPTTTTRYGMRAPRTFSATSMFSAVVPVTSKVAPVPASVSGRWSRMVWTRSSVFSLVGALADTAENTAVSPAPLNRGVETETTPGVALMRCSIVPTAACGSSAPCASTTMVSGPLKPGPKPWARSS